MAEKKTRAENAHWLVCQICALLAGLLTVSNSAPAQSVGPDPVYRVRLDLRQRDAFGRAAVLGLQPVDRRGNIFDILADAALLARLDSAHLLYESLDGVDATTSSLTSRQLRYEEAVTATVAGQLDADPILDSITRRLSVDSLVAYATRLEGFQTRFTYTDSNLAAMEYLVAKFHSFGYTEARADTFLVTDTKFGQGTGPAHNVLCTKLGTQEPSDVVLIGARYDTKVTDGGDPLIFAPGGDRDASGVAAVLEAARVLADLPMRKTVLFVAFGGGEQTEGGSNELADAFFKGLDPRKLNVVIDVDAIGFTNDGQPDLNIDADVESFGFARLAERLGLEHTWLKPRYQDAAPTSDWWPFAHLGYHWIDLREGDANHAHNTADDRVAKLDSRYWAEVAKIAALTTFTVAVTPSAVESLTVADVGDGASLQLRWARLKGSDIAAYRVYWGLQSGDYDRSMDVSGRATGTVIEGLAAGTPYFVSVTGLTTAGRESSVQPEAQLTPLRLPRVPIGVSADPDYLRNDLAWDAPIELDVNHYVIWRGADSNTLEPIMTWPDHRWSDSRPGGHMQYYRVQSVDNDGNTSDMSAAVSARAAVFDRGFLLLDMSDQGSGGQDAIQRQAVYDSIFVAYPHAYYRKESLKGLDKSVLGQYRTLVWLNDSPSKRVWPAEYWTVLKWYLTYHNDLVMTGWRTVEEIANCSGLCVQREGSFLNDRFGIGSIYPLAAIDCAGAHGAGGFPDLVFDTTRVPAEWHGRLGFLWGLQGVGGTSVALTYDSGTDNADREGLPIGILHDGLTNRYAFITLPFFYVRTQNAIALTSALAGWLGVPSRIPGDMDASVTVDVRDVRRVVDAVFRHVIPVGGLEQADLNGDCTVDILDVVAIARYVLLGEGELRNGCSR